MEKSIRLNRILKSFRIQVNGTAWFEEKRELELEALEWINKSLDLKEVVEFDDWKEFLDLPLQPLRRLISNLYNYGLVEMENHEIISLTEEGTKAINQGVIPVPSDGNWELLVANDDMIGASILGIWPAPKEKSAGNKNNPGPVKEIANYSQAKIQELKFNCLIECEAGIPVKLSGLQEAMLSVDRNDDINLCYDFTEEMEGPSVSVNGSVTTFDPPKNGGQIKYRQHKFQKVEYAIKEDEFEDVLNSILRDNYHRSWNGTEQSLMVTPSELSSLERATFKVDLQSNSIYYRNASFEGELKAISCIPVDQQAAQEWLNLLILDEAENRYLWPREISGLAEDWIGKRFANWSIQEPSLRDLLSEITDKEMPVHVKWHIQAPTDLIP